MIKAISSPHHKQQHKEFLFLENVNVCRGNPVENLGLYASDEASNTLRCPLSTNFDVDSVDDKASTTVVLILKRQWRTSVPFQI